jgi:hypothetical protein
MDLGPNGIHLISDGTFWMDGGDVFGRLPKRIGRAFGIDLTIVIEFSLDLMSFSSQRPKK